MCHCMSRVILRETSHHASRRSSPNKRQNVLPAWCIICTYKGVYFTSCTSCTSSCSCYKSYELVQDILVLVLYLCCTCTSARTVRTTSLYEISSERPWYRYVLCSPSVVGRPSLATALPELSHTGAPSGSPPPPHSRSSLALLRLAWTALRAVRAAQFCSSRVTDNRRACACVMASNAAPGCLRHHGVSLTSKAVPTSSRSDSTPTWRCPEDRPEALALVRILLATL